MRRTLRARGPVAALCVAMAAATVAPARAADPHECPSHGMLLDAAALCALPLTAVARPGTMAQGRSAGAVERPVRVAATETTSATADAERPRSRASSEIRPAVLTAPAPRTAIHSGSR